jgi:hypothetical protein
VNFSKAALTKCAKNKQTRRKQKQKGTKDGEGIGGEERRRKTE